MIKYYLHRKDVVKANDVEKFIGDGNVLRSYWVIKTYLTVIIVITIYVYMKGQ